jgi:hypothetical protein
MSDNFKIAIISAVTAVLTTLLTIWAQTWSVFFQAYLERKKRRAEMLSNMERYSAPLLHSTYDLQSRIYNIITRKFLETNLSSPDTDNANYAVKNTMFLFAQYFGWWELIRREAQFVDLGREQSTIALSSLLSEVPMLCRDTFLVHPGEQRAIGERMIRSGSQGPQCLGYADFLDAVEAGRIPFSDRLQRGISEIPNIKTKSDLIRLHSALIDVLDLLDPKHRRFPTRRRAKIDVNIAV